MLVSLSSCAFLSLSFLSGIYNFHQIWNIFYYYFFETFSASISPLAVTSQFTLILFLCSFHWWIGVGWFIFFLSVSLTVSIAMPANSFFSCIMCNLPLILPTVCIFGGSYFLISFMSLPKFLTNGIVITILMSLSANSNICASYSLISVTDQFIILHIIGHVFYFFSRCES
jgi:hypothetical protein